MTHKLQSPKLIFSFILILLSIFFFNHKAAAMDITQGDKVQVVSKDTTISAKYKFIAQFNKAKTKVVPFGPLDPTTTTSLSGATHYLSFNPKNDNSLKGKFGVTYQNVGTYENKTIDLKITVLDWSRYGTNDSGKISFQLNNVGENDQGYYYVDQKWEFYDHDTGEKVKIDGYMTINDIDSLQKICFSKETSAGIDSILVDKSTKGFLSYSNTNGEIAIYEDNGVLSDTNDINAMATILYSGLDTLRFKWERDFDRSNTSADKVYDPDVSDGEYFGYIAKKPAQTEMLDPSKTIEVNGKESDNVDIATNKTFSFNLYHQVPDEWSNFYYDNYSIQDSVDNRLAIQSIKILDEEDDDVSSYFDNQTTGNSVKLVAKSSILKDSDFYNHTYKVVVNVKVKSPEDLAGDVKDGKVSFDNTFKVTTNNESKTSNKVTATLNQRQIDVWHLDKINGSTLEHTTTKAFDGDSYSYASKDDFKKGDYSYIPTPKETQQGVVDGKDVVLKFYYQLPLIDVNMKHIQIYTDKSDNGLPVKLELTRVFPYGTSISQLANTKLKLELFEKGSDKALISKEYALKDVPTNIDDWTIPNDTLVKDTHKNYVVKIIGVDNTNIVSNNPEINTDGYTSSEENLTIDPDQSSQLSYKGVVMTEREIGKDMDIHYETLTIPLEKLGKQKTGYGFELKTSIKYQNDLAKDCDIKLNSLVDSKLIDSYLSYKKQGDYSVVPLEQTEKTISTDKKSTNYIFELPHVYVEEKTGYLFSDNQVAANDSRITNKLRDGGRKLYTPIWADLGNYNIEIVSSAPIGINAINFNINNVLNLYAYMYGTIGSKTLKDDEILIEPVDPKDPFPDGDLPSGWTNSDLKWLED